MPSLTRLPRACPQSFHDKWTCSGDPACDVWANSDAFEQGSFAAHLQSHPDWQPHITMSDARTHNAPCSSFEEGQLRGAIACHFLAEYKDQIIPYIGTRTEAARKQSRIAVALNENPQHDRLSTQIGPMLRVFTERVDPYFNLRAAPADRHHEPATLCHMGAGDGALSVQLQQRLRMPRLAAFDATATPDFADAIVRPFNGRDVPMKHAGCDVTVFAYMLHKASHASVTSRLLTEAHRVTSGYLLLAEDRAGRTVAEDERNAGVDPHGTFRSLSEWSELLRVHQFEVLAAGSMFDPSAPQVYMIARPVNATRR